MTMAASALLLWLPHHCESTEEGSVTASSSLGCQLPPFCQLSTSS